MEALRQDILFALRTLRKNLSVTLLATGSLALAIAGNTTVYSLVNSLLHRPLPYPAANRLVFVSERNGDNQAGVLSAASEADYLDWQERQRSFQRLAAFRGATYSYDTGGRPEQLFASEVTTGFFPLLGARTARGRLFLPEDGTRGHEHVVVLSHDFWERRFGKAELVGHQLKLNGEVYEVVGVLDKSFEWILAVHGDIWVPLVIEHGTASRQRHDLMAVGRLADGTTQKAAQAEMTGLMAQIAKDFPAASKGYAVELLNMRDDFPDPHIRLSLTLIQVALLFLLLIACANVANLLLARGQAREREFAIRSSLGADRRRIVAQLFTESLLMALFAGVAGVLLGYAGMRVLTAALAGFLPPLWLPTLDIRVLGYSLAVTLLGGVLFGIAPVLQTSHLDLVSSLKDGTQGATSGRRRRLAANILVIAEIALALGFLAGASMMIRTFRVMQTADPGFPTANLLIMQLNLPDARFDTEKKVGVGVGQVRELLGGLPGVRAVIVSSITPRASLVPQSVLEIEGRAPADGRDALPKVSWVSVSPGYFATLGIPLRQGRAFTAADDFDAAQVALVNQAMADHYWSGESPVGRRLTIAGQKREIVGVVATVHHDLLAPTVAAPVVYIPWFQQPSSPTKLTLQTEVSPGSLSEPVRQKLADFDPNAVLSKVQPLDNFVKQLWIGQQVFGSLLGGFGALALVLAALGTYGVLAYSVAQRTHEIGIRMAIGAGRSRVIQMIARQGVVMGLIGTACGIPLIFAQVKIISTIFTGSAPVQLLPLFGVAALLVLVTLLASIVPARRAATVDPIQAIRS